MAGATKLLDKVFNDDDIDLILGDVVLQTKSATRTVSSTARDNFIDVCLFFKKHGRLPQNSEENLVEHAVWSKMQGIINKPALIAQVRDLDDCGILDLAGESILLTRSSNVGLQSVEKDVRNDVTSNISPMCQLAKAIQSSLAAVTQELNRLDFSLSELITEQTFDDDAHKNINEQVLALSLKLQEVAGITRVSTQTPNAEPVVINHGGSDVELDPTPIQSQSTENEDIFSESFAEPGTAKEPCSIDDVFADDELDLLLGPDDVESAILSGRRATKMFDRANSEQTNREPCKEFDNYKSKFDAYRAALDDGRLVVSSKTDEVLIPGDVFLWDGLIAILTDKIGDGDAAEHSGERRQVIFSNGTEAWLREGSIRRCMYVYGNRGNKIVCKRLRPVTENLFGVNGSEDNLEKPIDQNEVTGHIYVVRTLSADPALSKIRKTAVKIGVTKNPVHLRVASAENDSTFLFAKVDVVNTFTLYNLEPKKVEEMLHAFFASARLKIRAKDRFGKDVNATEWFLVQPKLVTQAVEYLLSNTLHKYRFSARDGKIEKK